MLSARSSGPLLKNNIVTFALRRFPLSITAIWYQNRWLCLVIVSIPESVIASL
jgi:hypothetical protein